MKITRLVMLALFVASASLILSGCGKVYMFDFDTATVSELSEWYLDDWGGTVSFADGAVLDYYGIASPVSFDGDWTMSVVFDLYVDDDGNEAYFEVYPGDRQGWEPDNYIFNSFDYLGWLTEEEWYADDTGLLGYDYYLDEVGTIPRLNRQGRNTWKIVKTGDNFKTYMNGTKLVGFDAYWCDTTEDFYLNIYAELYGGELIFRSVKVEYKGNIYYTL